MKKFAKKKRRRRKTRKIKEKKGKIKFYSRNRVTDSLIGVQNF